MLAQFLAAAEAARTAAVLDELARKLWRAHSEGHLADADAKAISEAVEARRAARADGGTDGRTREDAGVSANRDAPQSQFPGDKQYYSPRGDQGGQCGPHNLPAAVPWGRRISWTESMSSGVWNTCECMLACLCGLASCSRSSQGRDGRPNSRFTVPAFLGRLSALKLGRKKFGLPEATIALK